MTAVLLPSLTHRRGGTITAITAVGHDTFKVEKGYVPYWFFRGSVRWEDGSQSTDIEISPADVACDDPARLEPLYGWLNYYLDRYGRWLESDVEVGDHLIRWQPDQPRGKLDIEVSFEAPWENDERVVLDVNPTHGLSLAFRPAATPGDPGRFHVEPSKPGDKPSEDHAYSFGSLFRQAHAIVSMRPQGLTVVRDPRYPTEGWLRLESQRRAARKVS